MAEEQHELQFDAETAALAEELTAERLARIRAVVGARQQAAVVLEDVHDPHNAQAVMRSCDAFGIHHIHLVFRHTEPWNPRKTGHQSSSSAHKWLSFTTHASIEACLDALHADGYATFATVLAPDSTPFTAADFTTPKAALLFGNEHRGLSPEALSISHQRIYIPMRGMVESLNISVAAAVCIAELTHQRDACGMEHYRLPPAAQRDIAACLIRRANKRLRRNH
jgi:tRNA (guanosine-2'-O-)-methyltransferase